MATRLEFDDLARKIHEEARKEEAGPVISDIIQLLTLNSEAVPADDKLYPTHLQFSIPRATTRRSQLSGRPHHV